MAIRYLSGIDVDSNTLFVDDANNRVGIGTGSPAYKLDVSSDIRIGEGLRMSPNAGSLYAVDGALSYYSSTNGVYLNGAGTNGWLRLNASGAENYNNCIDIYGGAAGAYMVFRTNNSERMRITSGGNVGIGTTNPYESLDVVGNIRIGNYTTAGTRYIGYANNTFGNQFIAGISIESTTLGGNYSQKLNFATHYYGVSAGVRMTIDEAGSVGIGTTTPSHKLDVEGNIRAKSATFYIGTTSTNYLASNNTDVYLRTNAIHYFEGNNFFKGVWDASGNLGIGTTAPAEKLHVNGFVRLVNAGFAGIEYHNTNGTWETYVGTENTGGGSRYNSASSQHTFYNNGSAVLRINSSGNVGIGTTAPGAKLHVEGNISAGIGYNGGFYANADSSTIDSNWGLDFSKSPSVSDYATRVKFYSSPGTSIKLGFWDSRTSSYMGYFDGGLSVPNFIIPSGNVGIGTTTVTFDTGSGLRIERSGASTIRLAGEGAAAEMSMTSSGYQIDSRNGYIRFITGAASGVAIERMRITSSGNVGIGTTAPVAHNGSNALIVKGGNGGRGIIEVWDGTAGKAVFQQVGGDTYVGSLDKGTGSGDLYLLINGTGSNADVGAVLKANGNVGIGTTSPSSKLHVEGAGLIATIKNSSAGADEYSQLEFAAGNRRGYIWLGNENTSSWAGAGGLNIYTANGNMDLWTSGVQRVRIDTSGNVGIGTTSPSAKLHLSGAGATELRITSTTANTNSLLSFYENALASWGIDAGQANGSFFIKDLYNSATRITITAAGNVGIGTTAPTARLHVSGGDGIINNAFIGEVPTYTSANAQFSHTSRAGAGEYSFLSANDGETFINSKTGTNIRFRVNNADQVIINSAGNVGIGTTSPAAKLQVGGAAKITGGDWPTANAGLELNYVTNTAYVGSYDRTNSVYKKLFLFSEDLTLETGAVTRMFITNGGNVLINTTTDSGYKLRVNGSSYFDAPILCYTGNAYITAITSDGVGSNNGFGYSFLITGANHEIGRVTGIYENSGGGGSGGLGFWTRGSGTLSTKMTLNSGGTLTLNNYGSGSKTGTVAYNLAVDASGNVIETAGGVVDGSGTANYITKWQDANTVTNSSITDDGTTVTATATNFVSQSNLGTAYTSFTTSGTTAIFDTITRTGAAIYQIVIVANPNSAGSGAYADFYYGKVFIGTGYNGSAVVDVINYHQESPMPRGLYGSGGGDLTVTAVMLVGGSEVTEVAVNTSYTIRIKIAGYNVAGSNTTVRLQRIM